MLMSVVLTNDSRKAKRPTLWLSSERPRLQLIALLQIAMVNRMKQAITITVQGYDELVKLIINLAMSRHNILRYE